MTLKWDKRNTIIIVLVALIMILFFTRNEPIIGETKEVLTERIVKVEVHDTIEIIKTEIAEPEIKYIVEEKDSIRVNEYKQKIESNNAVADLTIQCTGELKSIFGTITTEKVTKFVTKEKTTFLRDNKLYFGIELQNTPLYQGIDLNLAADFTIKDKWIVGAKYSPFSKSFGIKLGRTIF